MKFAGSSGWVFSGLMLLTGGVYAQNFIIALNVGYNSNMTIIRIELARPLAQVPDTEFIIGSSPHIALEFPDTASGLDEPVQDFTEGGLRSANIVQSGGRTRLVLYLNQMFPSSTRIDGRSLLITLQGNAANAGNVALRPAETKQNAPKHTLSSEADVRLKAEQEAQAAKTEVAGLKAERETQAPTEAELARPKAEQEGEARPVSALNINGSLRGSYWNVSNNPTGRNDLGVAEFWLKAAPHLGNNATLMLEGWARAPNVLHSAATQGVLREGYVGFSSGAADFRIGKQIIAWGRADQLNPTDNLSPRDNTLFIPEPDDQRQGTVAAKGTYNFPENFSGLAATAIWLPRFRPNKQPIAPAAGFVFNESAPNGNQFALKLEQTGQAVDWSLSYFRGFDLNPDIAALPGALNLSLQHHRIRVLGADAAAVIGRYGLRAEAAYIWTEDAAGIDPFVKNPFFYGVVGADRTFFEYLNINLQYFVRQISGFSDPNIIANPLTRAIAVQQSIFSHQQDKFQQGMSLRISDKWLNEMLEAELAAVYNFTRRDYMLRPKLGYAFNDHWKGSAGAILFRGNDSTFFGLLQDRSAMFGDLRYSF
ncbi:MAG: DUF1302 family protein [Gallionella sp.]